MKTPPMMAQRLVTKCEKGLLFSSINTWKFYKWPEFNVTGYMKTLIYSKCSKTETINYKPALEIIHNETLQQGSQGYLLNYYELCIHSPQWSWTFLSTPPFWQPEDDALSANITIYFAIVILTSVQCFVFMNAAKTLPVQHYLPPRDP